MSEVKSKSCEVCRAQVSELRRGRCWGCYNRWVENRPVGMGAACTVCRDRRHELLKSVELLGNWVPMCHNCSARTMELQPLPQNMAAIRSALNRERRHNLDRRGGDKDERVFRYERREEERRETRSAAERDADVIMDIDEILAKAVEGVAPDLTAIRPSPFADQSE